MVGNGFKHMMVKAAGSFIGYKESYEKLSFAI